MSNPLALPLVGIGGAAREFGDKIQAAFLAFARSGSPADPNLPDWPAYEPSRRATMILGRKFVVEDAPLEPERQLFEQWTEDFGAALAEV